MKLLQLYRKKQTEKNLVRGVRANNQQILSSRDLSNGQIKEIKEYYHDVLGINVPIDWHRYFYRRNGIYSVRYIPTSLYYVSLIGKFNHFPFNETYTDKNLSDCLFKDVRQPNVIMKNIRGHFYIENVPVDRETALDCCWNLDEAIIKPAFAAHGEGVRKFKVVQGKTDIDGVGVERLLDKYQSNYIIQSVVHQHPQMAVLNPTSVNTVRILTYRSGLDVLVLYAVVRIGKMGSTVDNETAGGISAKIEADGTLCKYAYGAPGDDMNEKTDSGVTLEGYKIPSYEKAVEIVKHAHLCIPYFDLIGWDIAIDDEGEPLLIEWNTWPELSQTAAGPAFGDNTERILKEVWSRVNTRDSVWG